MKALRRRRRCSSGEQDTVLRITKTCLRIFSNQRTVRSYISCCKGGDFTDTAQPAQEERAVTRCSKWTAEDDEILMQLKDEKEIIYDAQVFITTRAISTESPAQNLSQVPKLPL
jgi:hypothetical protein